MPRSSLFSILAFAPVILASTAPTPTITLKPTSSCGKTVCADYINSCGKTYGGCYPACSGFTTPTFTPPPCPTTTTSTSSCTQSICIDYINSCSQMYGGCFAACSGYTTPSFTDPGCPTTTSKRSLTTSTSSCGFICKDYFDDCGNTYGPGCYTACPGATEPTYTTPYCPTTTTTGASTSTTSCGYICKDYFDDCGNTFGPGCFSSCPGQADPPYSTPSCSVNTATITSISTASQPTSTASCFPVCKDYVDDCGNTYGPGCYTSCQGTAGPTFSTPYCSAAATPTPY